MYFFTKLVRDIDLIFCNIMYGKFVLDNAFYFLFMSDYVLMTSQVFTTYLSNIPNSEKRFKIS